MTRWVDSVLGQVYQKFCPGDAWSPAVNLYESPSAYVAVVDLAGVDPSELQLYVEEGVLTLSGSRSTPQLPQEQRYMVHLMEIDHGSFCRRVQLPGDVVVDAIEATYRSGLLVVTVPRKI